MSEPVPHPVRFFVVEHISSVGELEILLLLRATPDKWWSAEELGRATVTGESIAREHARHLVREGLAAERDDDYRYDAAGQAEVVDSLADCYARRRHTLIAIIYGAEGRQAATISNAFRIRKKR